MDICIAKRESLGTLRQHESSHGSRTYSKAFTSLWSISARVASPVKVDIGEGRSVQTWPSPATQRVAGRTPRGGQILPAANGQRSRVLRQSKRRQHSPCPPEDLQLGIYFGLVITTCTAYDSISRLHIHSAPPKRTFGDMYIPPASSTLDTNHESIPAILKEGSGLAPEKWSSLIGIITAICGNVLISFALNTQRYAHMRLSRDREEWELKRRKERRRKENAGYGTQQSEIAEERANKNLNAESGKYRLEETQDGAETDPLIPSVDSLPSKKRSTSSDDGERPGLDSESPEKNYLKSPIWWLGISMMTIGEAGNFLAYGFAPASVVSPLGVVALISNCMIAPWLLHEKFRWQDGIGVVIAVAGCVTIVMSASTSNPKLTPDAIWHLITRWEFETYFGITVILILALSVASNKFGDKTVLIDLGLMGLFGGYTALSTKGVASLLSNTIWRVVTFPITYLLVAVLVLTAVMQIKYVNRALQRFDSTQVIPTQFVLFTLSVIIGSAVLYRDFERTTTEDAVKFVGGCALTFLGVWCLTSGRGNTSVSDEEEGEDQDAVDLLDEEGVQPEIRERDNDGDRRQSLIPADTPRLNRFQTVDAVPSAAGELIPQHELAESSFRNKPADLAPASAAAIHEQSASNLPTLSDNDSSDSPQRPPMHATTSSPEISNADLQSSTGPKTPQRRGTSGPSSESPTKLQPPSTPLRQTSANLHPDQNQTASPKLLSRHSVAGFFPGPLTSPLSSSLSAVVADSLRRGVDRIPSSSVRRRSRLRSRADGSTDGSKRMSQPDVSPLKRHSTTSGEVDFEDNGRSEQQEDGLAPARPSGRIRSLSAAIGDYFGSVKSARRDGEGNG